MDVNRADDSFVGKPLKLSNMLENYKESPLYTGISALSALDSNVRLVKRDGNCFYYSVIFLMLEHYSTPLLAAHLVQVFSKHNANLILSGVDSYLVNEFSDPIMSVLKAVGNNEALEIEALDGVFWNYTVAYFRMITSLCIKSHPDDFSAFIEKPLNEYCAESVEAIDQYAGEVEMIAISKALSISFDLFCVEKERSDRFTRGSGENIGTLLFIADHFDILYI
ncbi:hypothetical protein NERG_00123 [Nematocida ausubeli]|uniref:ubiquitinyl hydrolase 1 n=1 Tax=Nematocida ausubeli (strain ATCC PRA-371 / ERTm2) TaxID=1913371 RepID=H8Z952_NEMA1|nr:hypothetical protein NERG_00123 [Nematocida ausubeli]KAI5134814.1 ubiquitin thioesterase protein OTUB1 [Nematocida ausubeli]